MDNKSRMDDFADYQGEMEQGEEGVSDQGSSIFDDNTGEIDRRSFGSTAGRDSSRTIPEDYERMLKEQEDFLKSLDDQFSSFSSEYNSEDEPATLEEMLTDYAEPVIEDIIPAADENSETDEFTIPEISIEDITENPAVREYEMPEIKIDDIMAEAADNLEDTIQIPDVNLDGLVYDRPDTEIYAPDVHIDLSDLNIPENLDDTIEIKTFLDEETKEIINDLSNMEVQQETYSELVVEDKPVEENIVEEQPVEEPAYEEVPEETYTEDQFTEEPVYEEMQSEDAAEEVSAPEEYEADDDVIVIKDNEYEGEESPLVIDGYEPTPYQENEPEEEYNPMFDELLKDEPVNEEIDEFGESDVDEFVEEEVPEWEAFVEQHDSYEEPEIVEEPVEEPVAEEPFVEEPVQYDEDRMPWEDMVETIDTAAAEVSCEEEAQQTLEENFELPHIENDETIDYSDLDIRMFRDEYEDEREDETEEDFNDFDIDAYIQENLAHTSNLVFPKFDEEGNVIEEQPAEEPVVEETPAEELTEVPAVEIPQEEPEDNYDVEASIRETFANINAEFPDFGSEYEEPAAEVPAEEAEPAAEEPVTEEYPEEQPAEEPVVEEVLAEELLDTPEDELPREETEDDYDVEASIRETFANINAEFPDLGNEYEEPAEEAPVEEAEVVVEDYNPEEVPAQEECTEELPAEEPIVEEIPAEEPAAEECAEEQPVEEAVTEEAPTEEEPAVPEEKAEIPEAELPQDEAEDDYDVEASIHETFANINAQFPDLGNEYEEPAETETVSSETAEESGFDIELEPVDLDFGDSEAEVEMPEIGDVSLEAPVEEKAELPEPELPQEEAEADYDVEASIHETFANINAEFPDFGSEYEEPAEELRLDIPEEEPVAEETESPETVYDFKEPVAEKPAPEEHVVTGRTAELRGLTDLDMTFMFDDDDSVDNIDSILTEIKDYNIEKGIRNVEDTQINIISEIKKEELMAREKEPEDEETAAPVKPTEKKSFLSNFFGVSEAEIDNYEEEEEDVKQPDKYSDNTEDIPVEQYTEEEIEKTKSSIMKAIADMKPIEEGELLYDDEPTLDNEFEAVYAAPEPQRQKAPAYQDQEHISVLTKQIEKERIAREEMFEQTQQLKLQVSEYENELNDVTNNMSRTNRILNVILTLLIIALFVILFIMGFFFAKERGLI